jgi:hypothetical protein
MLASHLLLRDLNPAAEICARRAVELAPDVCETWSTLGAVLHREQQYTLALEAHDRALLLDPHFAAALRNRGTTKYEMGDIDGGIVDFDHAMRSSLLDRETMANMAPLVLASGDFKRGFELAECRDISGALVERLKIPRWMGGDLSSRTILVYQDQGFGDTIQWARYLPQLEALAKRMVLCVDLGLFRLFRKRFETVVQPGEIPAVDCQVPICSLPWHFGVSEALAQPYVASDERALLPVNHGTKLKIGISWRGNERQHYGRLKSIPLEALFPLALIPGVQLYSLQPEGELLAVEGANAFITDLSWMIRDWADTAAILGKLDLVVTLDSALLHLAGAMGKPTFALLPYAAEWRWHPRGEDHHSRWYPSVSLLFQDRPGNWAPQVERASRAIQSIMAENPPTLINGG